ncbi:MAG: CinA family protein [Succinivibrio sp.]|nr:CinA family protein [Succinivibrio sp.]
MIKNLQDEIMQAALDLKELFPKYHQIYVTAESLTAGEIASSIVKIPGSSSYFEGGFVTYSNELKHDILGVKIETLNEFGAVSEAVVKQMTQGALNRATKATIAVAVSGIAGPDGGTLTKPVGTVWMAVQRRGEESRATLLQLHGSRDEIRLQTTLHALKALIETTVA